MTDAPGKPVALADGDELDAFVADHDRALVELYTSGCGLCASLEPVLGIVARAPDLAVGTVNPGDDVGLLDRFDVRSVPTFVLFVDGEQVKTLSPDGFVGADDLQSFAGVPA
jgi:thioredoxin 1